MRYNIVRVVDSRADESQWSKLATLPDGPDRGELECRVRTAQRYEFSLFISLSLSCRATSPDRRPTPIAPPCLMFTRRRPATLRRRRVGTVAPPFVKKCSVLSFPFCLSRSHAHAPSFLSRSTFRPTKPYRDSAAGCYRSERRRPRPPPLRSAQQTPPPDWRLPTRSAVAAAPIGATSRRPHRTDRHGFFRVFATVSTSSQTVANIIIAAVLREQQ